MVSWTPQPLSLDLDNGVPFTYAPAAISVISNTEAFKTGINKRDQYCIVCGHSKDDMGTLQHCHIVPQVETKRWDFLQNHGLIPAESKSVEHEARNGMLMCLTHQNLFDNHSFYIRWIPKLKVFVFINHSRTPELEIFHGRAVHLQPDNPRVPFHGAFLDQEMRVRGRWPYLPYYKDRPVSLPIKWQDWIYDIPQSTDGDGHDDDDENQGDEDGGDDEDRDMGDGDLEKTVGPDHDMFQSNRFLGSSSNTIQSSKQQWTKHSQTKASTQIKRSKDLIITLTNPFDNPSELEAIMHSSREQPNWKAAVWEGQSWEGTAEENMEKYQRIMNPPPVDWPKVIGDLTGVGGD